MDGQLRLALPYADNPSVDELFDAAEEAEQAGDLATAAMLYRRCVSMDQRDPIAPFNLANVLREQGERAAAKQFLELALASDPEFADAWYNLALLEEAAGDKERARQCLERAIAADPDYADPLYNLGKLQFELGCFAEASRMWQRYLMLDPDSEWSRRARSGLHLCQQHSRRDRPAPSHATESAANLRVPLPRGLSCLGPRLFPSCSERGSQPGCCYKLEQCPAWGPTCPTRTTGRSS